MNDVGEWPSYSVDILPGDSLVLASDGILELIDEENLLVKESKWLAQIQRSDRLSDIALDFGIDTISSVPDDVTVFWLKFGNLDEQRTNPVSAD
jgi:serine/threonine protein phosphatase PrpC